MAVKFFIEINTFHHLALSQTTVIRVVRVPVASRRADGRTTARSSTPASTVSAGNIAVLAVKSALSAL
jgi:hypothetical protein